MRQLQKLYRVCTLAIACAAAGTTCAQDFPAKPMRMIAAMPAGGGGDLTARWLAERLQAILRQNVIVENVAGAGGNIAAITVAKAPGDGYTIFFASDPIFSVNPFLYQKVGFDPVRDFAPVALVANTSRTLLVHPSFAASTVAELVTMAKARPGTLNFGSGGSGTSLHLAGELLKSTAAIDIAHVPYRGAAPALAALMGGSEIHMLFDSTATSIGHIRSGRIKGLAIASRARSPALPELPTFGESGMPGFEVGVAHGVLVPASTNAATVVTLNRAINTALEDTAYKKQMADLGVVVVGGTPEQFGAYLSAERKRWGEIIQKQGIKLN
ncbi:MAG: Bug family tripartite tricarboxylate transporter substrate binding protein [Burkholderiales bacterium]